jgi:hypothetical protein
MRRIVGEVKFSPSYLGIFSGDDATFEAATVSGTAGVTGVPALLAACFALFVLFAMVEPLSARGS